jgi:hypothetical protein
MSSADFTLAASFPGEIAGIGKRAPFQPGKILGVGEQRAPLRLQQVDDMQVFAPLLELSARGRQEVHVRVARPPSFRGHVSDAPDPQRQLSLTRLDPNGLTTWISNRSRMGTVTASPPARWKTYSATVCPTA